MRESRTLLQTVIEGTSDAIYVKYRQGRYLLFNSAAARATGKRADEVSGRGRHVPLRPDQARVVMDGDRAVMAGGKIVTYEENVTGASGELVTHLSTKGPLFDGQGRLLACSSGVARDITERKLAEEALQESEERHQLATSVAKEAIWEVNLKTGTVRWNRAYVELFGCRMPRPTAPVARPIYREDRDRVDASFAMVLAEGGNSWTCDYRMKLADDSYAYLNDRAIIVSGPGGIALAGRRRQIECHRAQQHEEALRQSEQRVRLKLDSILSPEGDLGKLELARYHRCPGVGGDHGRFPRVRADTDGDH